MKSKSSDRNQYEKLVLENVADIIVITDLEFLVQSWNPIAEFYYGIPETDAIGKNMNEIVQFTYPYSSIGQVYNEFQKNKFWQGEVSFTNREGETFYFLQTVKCAVDDDGEEIGILAVGRNITEKRRAEQKLLESEQFYRTLIADSLDITLLLNAEGEITFSTPSVNRLLGYEVEEVIGRNAFQYVHPEDLAWAFQSFELEVKETPEIKFIIVRVLKKNGDWLWCMVRGHNLLSSPYVKSIVVYIHDDTPRKQATAALLESEKRFRKLIRDMPTGVLLQDATGKIHMTNHAITKMFGISEEDVVGGKIWEVYTDVIHEDGRIFLQSERPSYKAMETGLLVKDVVMGVWNKQKKERIWILINADPIIDEDGTLTNIVSSFIDITERKRLEKKSVAYQRRLAQATIDGQEKERLEIGKELHDNIGQQLTTVKLFLDLAKTSGNAESEEMISMALKGISDVINEIRAMSRSLVPPSLKDLGFIDSVNDLIDNLRHTQSMAIELDYFEFDEDLLPENKKLALFRIIQEQLNNIIKHARAKKVVINLHCTSENVLLEVKDDGLGFDWSKIRKGLGFINITNRAELFGGKAVITSAPGNGCHIKINLPHKFSPVEVD
ncbi:MAG: PAS domain S-box protein [Flavisolibacter sp.]